MTMPPLHPDVIRHLFEYMRWADEQVVLAARTLGDEAYYCAQPISLGSVHNLLVHGLAAQQAWLARWRGGTVDRLLDHTDIPTREALSERWPMVLTALFGFLDDQTPATLATPLTYRNLRGETCTQPLGNLMIHVADHATYHRGQINSMIKLAGGTPSTASFANYVNRRP